MKFTELSTVFVDEIQVIHRRFYLKIETQKKHRQHGA